MQTVDLFLKRLESMIPRETKIKKTVIECISGIYHIDLTKSDIKVSGFHVSFNCSSQVRHILRSKQDILRECLTEKMGYALQIII